MQMNVKKKHQANGQMGKWATSTQTIEEFIVIPIKAIATRL